MTSENPGITRRNFMMVSTMAIVKIFYKDKKYVFSCDHHVFF